MKNELKVCIVDYGIGNIKAFKNIYDNLNINVEIASRKDQFINATHLILPGVGTYENVMNYLIKNKLDKFIKRFSKDKSKKIIGICIGMQILSNKGNETHDKKYIDGLGLINAQTEKLNNVHIGWNKVRTDNFLDQKFNNKYF